MRSLQGMSMSSVVMDPVTLQLQKKIIILREKMIFLFL